MLALYQVVKKQTRTSFSQPITGLPPGELSFTQEHKGLIRWIRILCEQDKHVGGSAVRWQEVTSM